MLPQLVCAGSPRDLGLDQGRACREAIQALARELGLPVGGLAARLAGAGAAPPRAALDRDLARYFPHLSERVAGLAAGARVPRDAVLQALELAVRPRPEARPDPTPAAGFAPGGDAERALDDGAWVLRTCDADGGHRSLTLTRPGFAGSVAGVNAPGLAGVAVSLAPPREGERCAAPGVLLLDQCLERFDRVEPALEWCERRPGGGRSRLIFADADGARGAVELDGGGRRRLDPARCSADPKAPRVTVDAAARALVFVDAGGGEQRVLLADHSR